MGDETLLNRRFIDQRARERRRKMRHTYVVPETAHHWAGGWRASCQVAADASSETLC